MGQLYDSAAIYNWDGTYDGGIDVPISPPTRYSQVRARFAEGIPSQLQLVMPVTFGDPAASVFQFPFAQPAAAQSMLRMLWENPQALSTDFRLAWDAAIALGRLERARWSGTTPRDVVARIRLEDATFQLSQHMRARWAGPDEFQSALSIAWEAPASRQVQVSLPWSGVAENGAVVRLRWRAGAPYQEGYTIPFDGDPDLPPGSTIVIPPADVYSMIPGLSIIRTSDSADLNAIDCSLRYDINSFAWTFQANCPYKSLELVDPNTRSDPELVQIMCNGYPLNMIVEGYSDTRKFGGRGVQISGRSRSALLGAPYAPRATFTEASSKDASQLATDALDGTGWTLVWNAVDWLVPGGTFTYADKTPIEAVAQIVAAIGAVLFCDPETLTLTAQSMYPGSPWEWSGATPFASIPNAFWTDLAGQWEGQGAPGYDGVIVSGQNGGVVGLVKLTGSAGANQLPPVNDALIVHTDARRERGRIELAKGRKRKTETIKMPVLLAPAGVGNPGIIPPGSLLEISEQDLPDGTPGLTWRGQVMSVQVDAQKAKVRQTLAVERHE